MRTAAPSARWPSSILEDMLTDMHMAGYSPASIVTRLYRLGKVLLMMEPGANLSHFAMLRREFGPIKPAFDPIIWKVSSYDLQKLGIDLMNKADTAGHWDEIDRADGYRTGLQIAILAARPWRTGVFMSMTVDKHLTRNGDRWQLKAESFETKHRRAQAAVAPVRLDTYIDRYCSVHRLALRKKCIECNALWINKNGKPQTADEFRIEFRGQTEARFGTVITPSLARKIAATTIATANPEQIHAVQGVLGHSRYGTGEQWYNMASSLSAFNDLDATMTRLEKGPRKKKNRR
ncbi:MAG: hypothetical protein ABL894_12745 [Hyphomicrobium sp.]